MNPKTLIGSRKCPLRLVPPALLPYVAAVMVVGDEKYTKFNWRQAPVSRVTYLEAIKRHALAALDGEDADPETGLPHEASIAACCSIALDAIECDNILDDRDKAGYVPKMLDRLAKRSQEIRAEFEEKRKRAS